MSQITELEAEFARRKARLTQNGNRDHRLKRYSRAKGVQHIINQFQNPDLTPVIKPKPSPKPTRVFTCKLKPI